VTYKKILSVLISLSIVCFAPLLAQKKQKGKASYYSKRATGARTSSGERLHHDSLTCAHRTFPFGTKLKVTNPQNGKWVIVRVTDRGPFRHNRIIDLSYGAARELDMLRQGVAMVIVEPVSEMIVPFKPSDDKTILEIDFEQMGNDIDGNGHPAWQDIKRENEKYDERRANPSKYPKLPQPITKPKQTAPHGQQK